MGLCCSKRKGRQTSALAKSSSLLAITGDLPMDRSLPRHDYVQKLIKQFRESSSPESIRRVAFRPYKTLCEYASASYHLPGAYVNFFPCPHCTYTDEEGRTSFVEVFHFSNVHNPNVFATLTFIMPADALRLDKPTECSVEVDFTKSCPNAPLAASHSPRVAMHIGTNAFIQVLCFLPRSELEKMLLVSRRWSTVVKGAEASLRQRRSFSVNLKFYGTSPGMLSVHFRSNRWRILRVLTTRGLSQALCVVRAHLRNAFLDGVFPDFTDRVLPPYPPREMRVDIPLSVRIDWLTSLLRSMPLNSEIRSWAVADAFVPFDNLPELASCALEPHKKLGCVHELELFLVRPDATRAQLKSLLNQPSIRRFREIIVLTTRVTIDTTELCAILSSCQSLTLTIHVVSGTKPQDALLTLPARIIRTFVALRDVKRFVAEFSLHLQEPDSIAFPEMPDVDKATDRRKRFRCHLKGCVIVVRVSVYGNPAAREYLGVVTFDHFRRTVLFLKGNVSLAYLRSRFQRHCICF